MPRKLQLNTECACGRGDLGTALPNVGGQPHSECCSFRSGSSAAVASAVRSLTDLAPRASVVMSSYSDQAQGRRSALERALRPIAPEREWHQWRLPTGQHRICGGPSHKPFRRRAPRASEATHILQQTCYGSGTFNPVSSHLALAEQSRMSLKPRPARVEKGLLAAYYR